MISRSWRRGDCCFTFNQQCQQLMVLNYEDINNQIMLWKNLEIENNVHIRCLEYNNKKFTTDDGRDWYVLVVQQFSPSGKMADLPQCPTALMLFGLMVNGYVYAFAEEETRNETVRKINTRFVSTIELDDKTSRKLNVMEEEEKQKFLKTITSVKDTLHLEMERQQELREAEEKAKKCLEELERMEAEETKKASPKSKKEKKPKAQKPKTNPYPEMVSIAKDIWKKNPKWVKWEKENKCLIV